jgi:ketosteroid isomerase-like protein
LSNGDNIRASYIGSDTAETQQEIKGMLDQYLKALQNRDLAALDRIWADDLTFINLDGDLLNKQNRMDNIKSGATGFKSIRTSDLNIRVYDEAAVAILISQLRHIIPVTKVMETSA